MVCCSATTAQLFLGASLRSKITDYRLSFSPYQTSHYWEREFFVEPGSLLLLIAAHLWLINESMSMLQHFSSTERSASGGREWVLVWRRFLQPQLWWWTERYQQIRQSWSCGTCALCQRRVINLRLWQPSIHCVCAICFLCCVWRKALTPTVDEQALPPTATTLTVTQRKVRGQSARHDYTIFYALTVLSFKHCNSTLTNNVFKWFSVLKSLHHGE